MALRALGQDWQVELVGRDGLSDTLGPSLTEIYPGLFSHVESYTLPKCPGSQMLFLFVAPSKGTKIWDEIREILKVFPQHEVAVFASAIPVDLLERADLITELCPSFPGERQNPSIQLEVVTGNGKGKTTYALGEALHVSTTMGDVLVIQFIKSQRRYGEVNSIEKIPSIRLKTLGKGFPEKSRSGEEVHRRAAQAAWEEFQEALKGSYAMIVLDELAIALKYRYLGLQEVRELLATLCTKTRLIVTGRYAPPELHGLSDMWLEMKEIRHPFSFGIRARRGIEF
jgi:cob(I)alamin adenosyltransferase